MFRKASKLPNVSLPKEFWKCLDQPLRGLLLRAKQLLEYTGIVICGICLILVYLWMKLMPAKMLYRILKLQLSHDIWWEEWDLHEGMSWVTPCMEFEDRGPGKIRYILNHRTKRAYMVVDVNQLLRIVRSGDIDSESLRALPEELKKRIEKHESKYMFGVFHYRNGVAEVTWQVSPDGKTHYLDKYGNGRTTGETKIFLSGAIDTRCRVVKKLRLGPDPDLGMDSD